ncbi:thiamine-phosphate kinase [Virgifigura deserti]|uniref:thiamine-phosphate kinase n=1 Tax=Virgifigura deserti TaxID=2268457 RepID=UPI003CCB7D2E
MTHRRLPGEFDLIARYFRPLAAGRPGALGLTDDAALIDIDPGHRLVVTADALIAGVHFLDTDSADLVARKMLRVNLSDLAAMGARPLAYFLTIAFSDAIAEPWVESFSRGLAADQMEFSVALMGGDVTATPGPLTLSLTALGQVGAGRALLRSGARAGDCLMVSGTVGDAALGLKVLRGGLPDLAARHRAFLGDRYHLPQPRLALGEALSKKGLATAVLDVSDGLVGDLGHICETSHCGAVLEAARIPLSEAARAALDMDPALRRTVVTGGDDYELLVAVPADRAAETGALGERLGVPLTVIGRITDGSAVRVEDESGQAISLESGGYRHF